MDQVVRDQEDFLEDEEDEVLSELLEIAAFESLDRPLLTKPNITMKCT
jgi:hypothetical protein